MKIESRNFPNERRCEKVVAGKTEMYPTFKINESWENLKDIPDEFKIDVESIDEEVSAAEDVVMSHAEYRNCMNTLKREITVEEGIKIQNRNIEKQIAAVEEETTDEDEIIEKMGNNNMAFLCRVSHRAIDKYQASIEEVKFGVPICCTHQEIISKCEDCKRVDSQEALDDDLLEDELYNSLITEVDPTDPEKKIIKCTMNYFNKNPEAGELKHSMVEGALKSSRRMYARALKAGKLHLIQEQLKKQEENSRNWE